MTNYGDGNTGEDNPLTMSALSQLTLAKIK